MSGYNFSHKYVYMETYSFYSLSGHFSLHPSVTSHIHSMTKSILSNPLLTSEPSCYTDDSFDNCASTENSSVVTYLMCGQRTVITLLFVWHEYSKSAWDDYTRSESNSVLPPK